jgi:hypothetical protein
VQDIITECIDQFRIPNHARCKIYDAKGYETCDDDMDFFSNGEPVFLSQGEEYDKKNGLALYEEIKVLG